MSYETKNIRNVCLLGHGGSGKTTLAESMLYMTGAIDRQGKTADGNTVCDYDPEEIKRQITISTSIAPVNFGGCKINVLDCPGFFDFAGDVMCALRAVEAGIIFCTAKDGIAVGAERSWKYLKNANMPCMFYVSKTNEDHGDFAAVLSALQEKHGSAVCAVTAPMSTLMKEYLPNWSEMVLNTNAHTGPFGSMASLPPSAVATSPTSAGLGT